MWTRATLLWLSVSCATRSHAPPPPAQPLAPLLLGRAERCYRRAVTPAPPAAAQSSEPAPPWAAPQQSAAAAAAAAAVASVGAAPQLLVLGDLLMPGEESYTLYTA